MYMYMCVRAPLARTFRRARGVSAARSRSPRRRTSEARQPGGYAWPESPGCRRLVGGDGYDGDGQGRRFWAVSHCPLGEAPFSAPQAKKILGPKCHFTEFCVVFEWVSHGSSSRISWEMDTRFGGHRYPTYSTFTGLLPGVRKV